MHVCLLVPHHTVVPACPDIPDSPWHAVLYALCGVLALQYGFRVQHGPIAIFVSTVPVILDTAFKWWLFKGLNRIDPSASVTLSEIDRH